LLNGLRGASNASMAAMRIIWWVGLQITTPALSVGATAVANSKASKGCVNL